MREGWERVGVIEEVVSVCAGWMNDGGRGEM
jgi:hypothetical protein